MVSRITNCYDSHTHFLATGQVAEGLRLHHLNSPHEVSTLNIQSGHYRAHWLTGFGWDQKKFSLVARPSRHQLDDAFPGIPVFFSRNDGHASWLSTIALRELEKLGLQLTNENERSGLLSEDEHFAALDLLPAFTHAQKKNTFRNAQRIFNQAGFTHLRDLSVTLNDWQILAELYDENNLTVCVDGFVTAQKKEDVDCVLADLHQMKNVNCAQLRVHGAKIFIDGTLGAKTAFVSENYLTTSEKGRLLWSAEEIKWALKKLWAEGFQVAVHTIGDQAAHTVVQVARETSAEGVLGRLHLEHVEVLRPETINLMKPLHVTCHLQPSHYIADAAWLSRTIPANLMKSIFPWELLRKNKIPFFFGSDSPIVQPSLGATEQALRISANDGVPELKDAWQKYHSHPDSAWMPSYTEIDAGQVSKVIFAGRPII